MQNIHQYIYSRSDYSGFVSVLSQQGKEAEHESADTPSIPNNFYFDQYALTSRGLYKIVDCSSERRSSSFMAAKHFRACLHRINSGLFKTINAGLLLSILYFYCNFLKPWFLLVFKFIFFITVIKELTPPYLWPHCHLAASHRHYRKMTDRQEVIVLFVTIHACKQSKAAQKSTTKHLRLWPAFPPFLLSASADTISWPLCWSTAEMVV